MYRVIIFLILCFASNFVYSQIYLADNGLTLVDTGINKRVQFGGTLLQNSTVDLGTGFTFGFSKGASSYLSILNNGTIGIGTSNPLYTLDINGSMRIGQYGIYGSNGSVTAPLLKFDPSNHVLLDPQGYGTFNVGHLETGDYIYTMDRLKTNVGVISKSTTTAVNAPFMTYGIARPDAPPNTVSLAGIGGVYDKSVWSSGLGLSFFTSVGADISGGANLGERMRLSSDGQLKVSNLGGTGTRMVVADSNGVLSAQAISAGGGNWTLNGNDIVNSNGGFVGIGTTVNPAPSDLQLKLAVNGNIYAQKLRVTQQGWADYVFEADYKLRPLAELESFIKFHKHLPEVPSAKEVEANGVDLGDSQVILLKKIEELTLYVIELKKEVDSLKEQNSSKKGKD